MVLLLVLLLALLNSGCAARGKAYWNARVGVLTSDQAILELGPPDKTARLTDGTTVSEWLLARGQAGRLVAAHGYYLSSTVWAEPSSPDVYLRLTFGLDGRMKAWQKVYK